MLYHQVVMQGCRNFLSQKGLGERGVGINKLYLLVNSETFYYDRRKKQEKFPILWANNEADHVFFCCYPVQNMICAIELFLQTLPGCCCSVGQLCTVMTEECYSLQGVSKCWEYSYTASIFRNL